MNQRHRGRPAIAVEIRRLIERMVAANPLWRASRIHGDLKMLGIEISDAPSPESSGDCRGRPARPGRRSCTNHLAQMVSIDFFTVPTITLNVLFVFIVLEHRRRKVLHFNVTEHPTAAWTSQQIVETFAEHDTPRYLLRDRDGVYDSDVRSPMASLPIEEILTAAQSLAESIRRAAHRLDPQRARSRGPGDQRDL